MSKKKNKKYKKKNYNKSIKNNVKVSNEDNNIEIDKVIDKDIEMEEIEELEDTTKIRVDKDRLDDIETLDISFIDKGTKKAKIKSDNYDNTEKSNGFIKFILFLFICIILCFISFVVFKYYNTDVVEVEVEKVVIDDNYLFLGDSITEYYNLNKYYSGMPVVNSGIAGNTTEDILKNIDSRVYVYNPSKVFILIGTNDLIRDISIDDTINNINMIIDKIKKNRPFCKIYLESIYPINNSDDDIIDHDMVNEKRDNKIIKVMNKRLKEVAENENIVYIDVYSSLIDSDGNLGIDYTIDGIHLSKEGYKVVTEIIKKYIEE